MEKHSSLSIVILQSKDLFSGNGKLVGYFFSKKKICLKDTKIMNSLVQKAFKFIK